MRRSPVLASIALVLSLVVPAHAGTARGYITAPAAHPTVARAAWEANPRNNGLTGWVFRLDGGADDATYSAVVERGATGVETIDLYFYEDLGDGSGPGRPCNVAVTDETLKTESGTICPGPQVGAWGVAVLVAGADARFVVSY